MKLQSGPNPQNSGYLAGAGDGTTWSGQTSAASHRGHHPEDELPPNRRSGQEEEIRSPFDQKDRWLAGEDRPSTAVASASISQSPPSMMISQSLNSIQIHTSSLPAVRLHGDSTHRGKDRSSPPDQGTNASLFKEGSTLLNSGHRSSRGRQINTSSLWTQLACASALLPADRAAAAYLTIHMREPGRPPSPYRRRSSRRRKGRGRQRSLRQGSREVKTTPGTTHAKRLE